MLVVLRVADLGRARAFYEALGLVFVEERHGTGPAHLSARLGDLLLELYPRRSSDDSTSATRLGFAVEGVDALVQFLPRVITPPTDGPWGRRAVVQDPDGHTVELTETARA